MISYAAMLKQAKMNANDEYLKSMLYVTATNHM